MRALPPHRSAQHRQIANSMKKVRAAPMEGVLFAAAGEVLALGSLVREILVLIQWRKSRKPVMSSLAVALGQVRSRMRALNIRRPATEMPGAKEL